MPRPRGVGMPRPKKKKLQDVNDDSQPSTMDAGIDADPSKGSAARPSPVAEPPPPPSPGGRVLQEAKYNYEEALLKSRWLDELAKKAKDKRLEPRCIAPSQKKLPWINSGVRSKLLT